MDSLALDDTGTPLGFFTKLFPLPHLRGAMCVTGVLQIGLDWFVEIQSRVIAKDVVFLDSLTPGFLRTIARKYDNATTTTTVYHFGYDDSEKRFRGFAYRSTKEFNSEELQPGLGIKPQTRELVQAVPALFHQLDRVEAFVELFRRQKIEDEGGSARRLVGIGGEIHLLSLTATQQTLWTCYRFDDYLTTYEDIVERLRGESR